MSTVDELAVISAERTRWYGVQARLVAVPPADRPATYAAEMGKVESALSLLAARRDAVGASQVLPAVSDTTVGERIAPTATHRRLTPVVGAPPIVVVVFPPPEPARPVFAPWFHLAAVLMTVTINRIREEYT